MEANQPGLLTLPRRPYNQPVKFHKDSVKECLTNFYEVDLGGKMSHIYQFSFEVEPEIPADSKDLLH